MLPHLLRELTGSWRSHLESQGIILRQPLTTIQRSSGSGTSRKVTFLVFEHGAKEPRLVLKVPANSTNQSRLKHEHQVLCKVWDEAGNIKGIPRPLGFFELNGTPVLIESYLPGISMTVILRRRLRTKPGIVRKDLDQALTWLSRLQSATYTAREAFPAREVAKLSLFQLSKGTVPEAFTKKIQDLAKDWDQLELPLVSQHGDFWPGNIMINNSHNVGVIDWEDYAVRANPFHDLFSFLTAYALALPWRLGRRFSSQERFARLFLEDNWLAGEMLSCINQFIDNWLLPRECIPFFYALFLLKSAQPTPGTNRNSQPKSQLWLNILRLFAEQESHSVLSRGSTSTGAPRGRHASENGKVV